MTTKRRTGTSGGGRRTETAEQRIRRRKRNRENRRKQVFRSRLAAAILALVLVLMIAAAHRFRNLADPARVRNLSEEVLALQGKVEEYAKKEGISFYVPYLLAIMEVESGGKGEDVMQSSESLGMEAGTLDLESSISQGCRYFSEVLIRAEDLGCDMDCVLQAYNYGISFLDYAAENAGGTYSFDLARDFARDKSGGETVIYLNPIAIAENGGWRYAFGNMFYVELVRQYLE